MKIITNTKLKIANFLLKRKLKKIKRKKNFVSMNDARSIVILFDASDKKIFETVSTFSEKLISNKKEVCSIGFVQNKKTLDFYKYKKGVSLFSTDDLNFLGMPSQTLVDKYIKSKADLLIDLNINNNFQLKFISCLSKASFKIGIDSFNPEIYDMTICLKNEKSISYLIEQIELYLAMINFK